MNFDSCPAPERFGLEVKPDRLGVSYDGRSAISLVSERRVAYSVVHVQNVFDPANATLGDIVGPRQALFVVDATVRRLYGVAITSFIKPRLNDVALMSIIGIECEKSLHQVERICAEAVRCGLPRDGIIVAVGGGVTLDIAGLAASLYRRGVDFVRIPTTLIGLVDVGVGIKQGVNFASKKSILGTFYPPVACINDSSFLRTLSDNHISCGIAEILKIALVCDRALFELLEQFVSALLKSHFQTPQREAEEILFRAELGMMRQLQSNLFENDLRRLVDFGHTISPILEAASGFQLPHGEAVAVDMMLSTAMAVRRGMCESSLLERLARVYEIAHLPITHDLCGPLNLSQALRDTRKHRGGALNMVVPTGIGSAEFLQDVTSAELMAAMEHLADRAREHVFSCAP
jgi:3-dehydroquinate synthetase